MVEYETVGIIAVIVGLVSFQIKVVNDRLKEEIANAKEIHGQLCGKISNLQKAHDAINEKLNKIGDKIGVIF
jgi:hypothetical protein